MKKKIMIKRKNAIRKILVLENWEKQNILIINPNDRNVQINYLIWHLWSNKGLIKLCQSLYFYLKMKCANENLLIEADSNMKIYVDYGNESNDYQKTGVVPMVQFHPKDGFKEL